MKDKTKSTSDIILLNNFINIFTVVMGGLRSSGPLGEGIQTERDTKGWLPFFPLFTGIFVVIVYSCFESLMCLFVAVSSIFVDSLCLSVVALSL